MKKLSLPSLIVTSVLPLLLASCLFQDPVFTEGFVKTHNSITGVWVIEEEMDDMEKAGLAACFKLDDSHYVMHYPAREKDGIYFSVQPLKVRDRDLLQLRALGTLKDRPVRPGDKEVYTLVWLEKAADGKLSVRPLNWELKKKSPADLRRMIEDPGGDWNALFVEPKVFKRISKE